VYNMRESKKGDDRKEVAVICKPPREPAVGASRRVWGQRIHSGSCALMIFWLSWGRDIGRERRENARYSVAGMIVSAFERTVAFRPVRKLRWYRG